MYVAIIAVLLASIAATNVGSVGFIGLLAPHAARMLVGARHRQSMVIAAARRNFAGWGRLDRAGGHDSEGIAIGYRYRASRCAVPVIFDGKTNKLKKK